MIDTSERLTFTMEVDQKGHPVPMEVDQKGHRSETDPGLRQVESVESGNDVPVSVVFLGVISLRLISTPLSRRGL